MRKVLVAALLLALSSGSAFAGYAYPAPPPSWGGSAGAWTYGGTAAANAPWINGSAAAQVTTNVAGRAITVPASMRLAANAGSVVARAILTNPAMRLAPMLTWAAAALWVYDSVNERWMVPSGPAYTYTANGFSASSRSAACAGAGAARVAELQASFPSPGFTHTLTSATVVGSGSTFTCLVVVHAVNNTYGTESDNESEYGITSTGEPVEESRPATQADADALAEAHPMPDAVARAADDVMPLPQALPELAPVSQPIGAPYERSGEPWQDRAVIEPRNDEAAPWRVDQRIESAPVDSGSPSMPVEQQPTFCESNPSSIACQAMDVPAQQDIPQTTRNIAVTPQSGWGADNAACPAARHITAGGHDIPIPFDMFCTYFGWLRYIIIAFAWLGAGFILLGRID